MSICWLKVPNILQFFWEWTTTDSPLGLFHFKRSWGGGIENFPLDYFGTVVGENPDCQLLSGTVVGENPDHVCWVIYMWRGSTKNFKYVGGRQKKIQGGRRKKFKLWGVVSEKWKYVSGGNEGNWFHIRNKGKPIRKAYLVTSCSKDLLNCVQHEDQTPISPLYGIDACSSYFILIANVAR